MKNKIKNIFVKLFFVQKLGFEAVSLLLIRHVTFFPPFVIIFQLLLIVLKCYSMKTHKTTHTQNTPAVKDCS